MEQVSAGLRRRSLAASLNNRAVLTRPKLETPNVNKRIDSDKNDYVIQIMKENFVAACRINPECFEAHFNRILLKWRDGEIFDERVC